MNYACMNWERNGCKNIVTSNTVVYFLGQIIGFKLVSCLKLFDFTSISIMEIYLHIISTYYSLLLITALG